MKNESLASWLCDNWSRPFKTVSFWALSIATMLLHDKVYNSFPTPGNFVHTSGITDWVACIAIIIIYIFAIKIDRIVKNILSSNKE